MKSCIILHLRMIIFEFLVVCATHTIITTKEINFLREVEDVCFLDIHKERKDGVCSIWKLKSS